MGNKIGGAINITTKRPRPVPIHNDPQRVRHLPVKTNFNRSPSNATGMTIKPAETVAPGAGPGRLQKRGPKDMTQGKLFC